MPPTLWKIAAECTTTLWAGVALPLALVSMGIGEKSVVMDLGSLRCQDESRTRVSCENVFNTGCKPVIYINYDDFVLVPL